MEAFISGLELSLDALEPAVDKLVSKSYNERVADATHLEKIKLTNGYTYILSSLLFAYLKSQGLDTSKHAIMLELDRCKSYMKRLKDLELKDDKELLQKEQDAALVQRFMKSQLQGNSTLVTGVQEPAISRVQFQGKHKVFTDDSDDEPSKPTKLSKDTSQDTKSNKTAKPAKVTKPKSKKLKKSN